MKALGRQAMDYSRGSTYSTICEEGKIDKKAVGYFDILCESIPQYEEFSFCTNHSPIHGHLCDQVLEFAR